jgi:HSP20 family protein
MSKVIYDPFRDIRSFQDELNRVFNPFQQSEDTNRPTWTPNVDVFEVDNQIVLEAELAGLKSDEVDVSIENNVVTIKGERKFTGKDQKENYRRIERSYGAFSRSFNLPRTVVADEVTADFENGVLKVTLPKREEAKARKIEIKGNAPKLTEQSEHLETVTA